MANEEHLKILKQGVGIWNQWRKENPEIDPNLIEVKLGWPYSTGIFLRRANLSRTNLSRSCLGQANLIEADLSEALLADTDLRLANLTGANLRRANLREANLRNTDLTEASFVKANLTEADLTRGHLSNTDFAEAKIGWTILGNLNLSQAQGLGTIQHAGPSNIDVDTLYQSASSTIPETFYRGTGVPDSMIEFMHSLVRSDTAIDFFSCFISYSSRDQAFAERLHADLQAEGVRCWFAPEHMKIGDRIRPTLDQSVLKHDKLLIILSENSIGSDWVEQEVETALARESQEKRIVLFPIRLDDTVMEIDVGWPALIRNTRHIGDFRNWKDHDAYQQAFSRLLRDLKAEHTGSSDT